MVRRPVALASALLLILATPLPTAQATGTRPSPVDKVYAHAEHSLLELGVYHLRTTTVTTVGKTTYRTTQEQWVDVARGVSRSQSGSAGSAGRSVSLLADNVQWYDGRPTSPQTCHGVDAATNTVLGCPFSELKDNTKVIRGRYKGRSVPVLVVHAVGGGEDAIDRTTTLTYLDPKTALPLASIESGTHTTNTTVPLRATTTYRSERLRLASLPKNFFTPASLGWKAPDPLKGLPHGIPVYWPGQTWTPGGTLPAVTLQGIETLPASPLPMYQEILQYARASDPYGPPVLSLQLWKARDWAKAKVGEPVPLCKPVSVVTLLLGRATFRCPDDGVDGPFADIDVPGAHITVDAPSLQSGAKIAFSPFATIPALETVLNALTVRP